ncbi:alpha/beta hydrolase family protein [Maribacter sp. 2210JD10-5]|uniref:alpha/beta hydrolase family protein n=1 Tax=Maribacter sp. 2210JD10-5 TaxID=3386272 RepID=UPI0039BC7938
MKKIIYALIFSSSFLSAQQIISEEIELTNGKIQIPGTLSYPETSGKVPLIIFVHGSGNVDRNGNQAGVGIKANYIKALRDSLNNRKIAFYSYDKRTSIPSNMPHLEGILFADFVDDVKVAITRFAKDDRFNAIYLIGHSQGSLVAMLSMNKNVDGYISLAGPSDAINTVIVSQLTKQSAEVAEIAKNHFKELKETDTIQKVNPFLLSLFAPQNQKFMASWMQFTPSEEIQKITVPILILQGDSDLQVSVEDARSLSSSNPKSKLHIIPKMNHVLKEVNSLEENQKSYSSEGFPLSNELVNTIVQFILEK